MSGLAIKKTTLRYKYLRALGICLLVSWIPVITTTIASGNTGSSDRTISEYEVKAAYVYNFAKFVEWPPAAFSAKTAPITIGIVGDEEFGTLLGRVVKDKIIQEHTIQVRFLKWPADLRSCHMVFVSSTEQKRFRQIAESLQGGPILTITEADETSQAKGIMNLFVEGGKVQFEVNLTDAEKAKLRISSKLLRLARGTVGSLSGKGE